MEVPIRKRTAVPMIPNRFMVFAFPRILNLNPTIELQPVLRTAL
jgi:hypothetical protein